MKLNAYACALCLYAGLAQAAAPAPSPQAWPSTSSEPTLYAVAGVLVLVSLGGWVLYLRRRKAGKRAVQQPIEPTSQPSVPRIAQGYPLQAFDELRPARSAPPQAAKAAPAGANQADPRILRKRLKRSAGQRWAGSNSRAYG